MQITPQGNGVMYAELDAKILDEANIQEMARELEGAGKESGFRIILDFRGTDFVSSAAIGKFHSLHKMAKSAGGLVVLCSVKDEIMEVLRITKLDEILTIVDDSTDAMAQF